MKSISILLFSFFFTTGIFAQSNTPMRGVTHSLRSDTIDVLNYDLHLYVPSSSGNIYGYTAVTFSPKMSNVNSISLDLLKMTIDSVKLNGNILSYTYDDTLLISTFPSALNSTDTAIIYIYYRGTPQQDPSSWGGWYFSSGYSFNLGVGFESIPHNFGRVFHPCFDNFMEHATYDFYITTSINNKAYCNGKLISDTLDLNGDRVRHWKMDDPITSYLASIAVANYTQVNQQYFSTVTTDTIPIQLTSLAADTSDFKSAFVNLPYAIEAFEESYGAHFFNKIGFVAVPFSSGAMEHATNIAFPVAFLGNTFYESVMAHELAHHWWGDLVTCKSAEDMWINEGMATYSEKLFFENRYGPNRYKSEVRSGHKSSVWKHHVDDGGFFALSAVPQVVTYGTHSYTKGSDVAHTLRGYLGDSLFFLGLKTILANNQLQNINSNDFMNQLNAVNGIDVTDFFNDWINQPGYLQFEIDSFVVVPNGGNFDVTVYTRQKMRGANHYGNNVPVSIFFRDNDWSLQQEKIYISGQFSSTTFTIPFAPTYVALNEDEKISDAITGDQLVIKTTGTKSYPYANFTMSVQSLTDSAFVRVEHNWVKPHQGVMDPTIVVSKQRYWRIHGIDFQNLVANAAFVFNGTTAGSGYLDDSLMMDYGSVSFEEDSIILLYREKASDDWMEFPNYTINTQGSSTSKTGVVNATNILEGEYTFGLRVYGVGINEKKNKLDLKLFPNPNDGNFKVDMGNAKGDYTFSLYDNLGSLVVEKKSNEKIVSFATKQLANGIYHLSVKDKNKVVANLPINVIK